MADPKQLMARYCDGEATAFRELYQIVAPQVLDYLAKMAHRQACADELLQRTFATLHRTRASYIRGADPIPWIYAIAHQVFLAAVREAAPRQRDTSDAALEALSDLPEPLRQAVVLLELEGKTVAEAAAIAGITETKMRQRADRGYRALREHFAV